MGDSEQSDPLIEERDYSRLTLSRRGVFAFAIFVISAIAFMYLVIPQLPGLRESFDRVRTDGNRGWLAAALAFELGSYFGYILLFRAVFVHDTDRIGWRESYEISMAGVAATRLFATAGAGGVVLTYWAVRRAGIGRRTAAVGLVAFFVLLYGVFMLAILVDGVLLRAGVFPGDDTFGFTVVPAIFAGAVIALTLATTLLPGNVERLVAHWSTGRGRVAMLARRLATAPALLANGVRRAISLIRDRDIGILGALVWWGCDVAVLWACFQAFGGGPPESVLVMGYLIGMLANTLPLPGGIGAVEGGMIGSFVALGVGSGPAVVAVLAYRIFAFWLPTLPGTVAYFHLRRTVAIWRVEDATIQNEVMSST